MSWLAGSNPALSAIYPDRLRAIVADERAGTSGARKAMPAASRKVDG